MALEAGTYIADLNVSNPVGSTDPKSQGDDHLRLIKTAVKNTFPNMDKALNLQRPRTDLTSGTTTDLGATVSDYINVTGTTTITSFGTIGAGTLKNIRFNAALILTHNASSLILPSAANITTVAGDHALAISLGSGNWQVLIYQRASGRALVAPLFSDLAFNIIDNLVVLTTLALDDEIFVTDLSDSKINKGIVPLNLFKVIALFDLNGSPDSSADGILTLDASDSNKPKLVYAEDFNVAQADVALLAPGTLLAILEDQKAANTSGGTFSNGAWRDRDLNTEVFDRATYVTLSANAFILAAGTYDIEWSTAGYAINGMRSKLVDVTNTVDLGIGSTEFGDAGTGVSVRSTGACRVTLAGTTSIKVQGFCQTSRNTDGFGKAANLGSAVEIYTRVVIRKG